MSTANVETTAQKITRLEAENAALKEKAAIRHTISMKVSEKGALSIYGLGRFPVTLYAGQWERLLPMAEKITAFIAQNAETLNRKE